jgi:hypothetical protein
MVMQAPIEKLQAQQFVGVLMSPVAVGVTPLAEKTTSV